MVRIERQNAYITKLNSKLSHFEQNGGINKGRKARSHNTTSDERHISKSVEELPDLRKG